MCFGGAERADARQVQHADPQRSGGDYADLYYLLIFRLLAD